MFAGKVLSRLKDGRVHFRLLNRGQRVINSFGTKFQMTFVGCFFFILTNYRLERCLYVKLKC